MNVSKCIRLLRRTLLAVGAGLLLGASVPTAAQTVTLTAPPAFLYYTG
jgi:hypothetical protein